ncbi:MAG: CS1 type fimbrial major subunit [Enterobacterales bacterium]|uniref:CS1 type fimbrial major subunit n=1 Tax=Serratia sp. (in: enterobacteria) TaxID=616 RepID=UPI003F3CF8A9
MRKLFKPPLMVFPLVAAFAVQAVQKDITVNADVDASLNVTQADSSALPGSITMQYLPGKGLMPYNLNTKIWSNTPAIGVFVRLGSVATLADADGSKTIPLSVSLGGKTLTTTNQTLEAEDLFSAEMANGSDVLPLRFSQTTQGVLESGNYTGTVSLVVTLAIQTISPNP